MSEKIEYETVTIKLPKAIMSFLRQAQTVTGDTPEEDIQYYIIESIRSRIDCGGFFPSHKQLADQYHLNPIFKKILDDEITS